MGKEIGKERILKRMAKLAQGKANDAVKLAFLDSERVDEIDGLDLTALTAFKRSGNGAVEIKLADRMAVLEKMAELADSGEGRAEMFFKALEGTADRESGEEHGGGEVFGEAETGAEVVV